MQRTRSLTRTQSSTTANPARSTYVGSCSCKYALLKYDVPILESFPSPMELPIATSGRQLPRGQIWKNRNCPVSLMKFLTLTKLVPISNYLTSHKNLLLSVSSRLINHSLNDGWKNMYVLSIRLTKNSESICNKYPIHIYLIPLDPYPENNSDKMYLKPLQKLLPRNKGVHI